MSVQIVSIAIAFAQGLSCLVYRRDARFAPAGKSSLEFRPRSSSLRSDTVPARPANALLTNKTGQASRRLRLSFDHTLQALYPQTIRNFLAGVCKELPFSCSDNPLWSVTAKKASRSRRQKISSADKGLAVGNEPRQNFTSMISSFGE